MPEPGLLAHLLPGAVEVGRSPDAGPDRDATGRWRAQVRDVEVRIEDLAERPRDGRRRHQQHVRRAPVGLGLERVALFDPESMLFVDDDEPEVAEADRVLDQRVRPDHDRRLSRGDVAERLGPAVRLERPGQQGHADPEIGQQRPDGLEVLAGEKVRRGQQRALQPVAGHGGERIGGDRGLARAHVALEQAEHRRGPREVVADRARRRHPGRR